MELLQVLIEFESALPAVENREPKLEIDWRPQSASLMKEIEKGNLVLLDRSILRAIINALVQG